MKFNALILFLLIGLSSIAKEKLIITHGPFLQHLNEKEVTIVWSTNTNAVSWVELWAADSVSPITKKPHLYYSAEYGLKDVSIIHSVRLGNLKPATCYRYKIHAQQVRGSHRRKIKTSNKAVTAFPELSTLQFSTGDTSKSEKISFVMVNDIHARNDLLEDLLIKGDYQSADFIFFNGDMVNNIQGEAQFFDGFMDTAIRMFAKQKPLYYARGNHETRGPYAWAFPKYFKSPSGKLYYLLRRGPICFLVLDGGDSKPDPAIGTDGMAAFVQYRDAECEWIKEAMKSEAFLNASFKVAILHIPPIGNWYSEKEMASKFIPILNEANIDVMLCGHLHKYLHQQPGNETSFPVIVNSNTTVLKANADDQLLQLEIIDRNGSQVDFIQLKKQTAPRQILTPVRPMVVER
jgi:predicted phosphodiesterase